MSEEKYKQFDSESAADTSQILVVKGYSFRKREVVLGVVALVCLLIIIILAALLASSNSSSSPGAASAQALRGGGAEGDSCYSPSCLQSAAHTTELMDPDGHAPCQDFHSFACSNFAKLHPLEPDHQELTTSWLIYYRNQDRMHRLIERVNLQQDHDHYEYKLRVFFDTCTDHYMTQQLKGKPFVDKVLTPAGGWWLMQGDRMLAQYDFHRHMRMVHVDFWTDAFFTFSVVTDYIDWTKRTIKIDLSGIGMNWYYYYYPALFPEERSNYTTFIRTVSGLLLRDSGTHLADDVKTSRLDTVVNDVMLVETELAKIAREAQFTADYFNHSQRLSLSTLNSHANGAVNFVDLFSHMFREAGVTGEWPVVVTSQEYINRTTAWINNLPVVNKSRVLNNYMTWRMAHTYVQDLSYDYMHANRQFHVSRTGQRNFLGNWRYCVNKLDRDMHEALSALFVKNHFGEKNRQKARTVTQYVKQAMVQSLVDQQHWMSPQTRTTATQKLTETVFKLGYPDYLMNDNNLNKLYSQLQIQPDDYFGNLLSFNAFFRQEWSKWLSSTATQDRLEVWAYRSYAFVAEYYNPWKELIVPAGLLQAPIFDHNSPNYMNFGSLGSVVGRQLTHAIDQIGNSYQLNGSHFGSWWSKSTTESYRSVRECIIKAYQNLTNGPFPGQNPKSSPVNATNFVPTALGDATGVKLAYKAYQAWVQTNGKEKAMPGKKYTNNQLFFINYAQTFCYNRDSLYGYELARGNNWIQENVRVNAALAQVKEFQEAFQCRAGDQMVAPSHCSLF